MKKRETESSMPQKPALKGSKWTEKQQKQLLGRWVKIGWEDAPAEVVLVVGIGSFCPKILSKNKNGRPFSIDDCIDEPTQIIAIGDKVEFPEM